MTLTSRLAACTLAASLFVGCPVAFAAVPDATPSIEITRNGAPPATPGPASRFTGRAFVQEMLAAHAPSRLSVGSVSFEPGTRSNWHTHPAGQILIVTAGLGWVQQEGGPVQEMRPGDLVWIPPGVKHWHGASASNGVTHLAIQESVDGRNVEWLEPVSSDQYRAQPEGGAR